MSGKKHHSDDEQTPAPEAQAGENPQAPADPVAALQAERDDLLGRLQRVSADFLNYKKRVQREIDEARQFASVEVIKQLLPVLDDMERALAAWRADPGNAQALGHGTQLVQAKLTETLARQGLTPVEDPVGQAFDPAIHSAICQQPKGGYPEHTVLEAVRKGYRLHGRTIRPAEVVVSRLPDPPGEPK
ncbi:MAG: nucleotide exchange factor GrpE [Planctomycetota bacterium]|nr:nucleotide exchange factor GrpE [Planctomycetota bacterium]